MQEESHGFPTRVIGIGVLCALIVFIAAIVAAGFGAYWLWINWGVVSSKATAVVGPAVWIAIGLLSVSMATLGSRKGPVRSGITVR